MSKSDAKKLEESGEIFETYKTEEMPGALSLRDFEKELERRLVELARFCQVNKATVVVGGTRPDSDRVVAFLAGHPDIAKDLIGYLIATHKEMEGKMEMIDKPHEGGVQ